MSRETRLREALARLDRETLTVMYAFDKEVRTLLKVSSPPTPTPAPDLESATIVTTIRVDELSVPQRPHPQGSFNRLNENFCARGILHQKRRFPDSPHTLSWACDLEGSCRNYCYDDDGTHVLHTRPITDNYLENKLARPDIHYGRHHTWRLLSVVDEDPHRDGPPKPLRGAIIYHSSTPDGPPGPEGWGLEFPPHDCENPLLDGERLVALMLLSRQRTSHFFETGEVRIASVTHSAVRIILVTLDPSADPTIVPVTFRILKTVRLDDSLAQHDWNQLVFLMSNPELDLGEDPSPHPSREGSPAGEPSKALGGPGSGADSGDRVVSEDLGFPRSSGKNRIFSRAMGEESPDSSSSLNSGSSCPEGSDEE